MEDVKGQVFDLPTLLRMGGLDVRKAARNKVSLQVDEYYSLLNKFIKQTPLIMETINRIIALEGDENDFQSIATLKDLLEDIGCYKYTAVINDIINAGKRGHNGFAADCAKQIKDAIDELSKQIQMAKKTVSSDNDPYTDDPTHESYTASYEEHSLKKVLQVLDHSEATRKMRVLAVDDAPVMIKTISSVLGDSYKIYGMTDPTKLENFLQQVTPELFLLDYKMPELSGFDLIPIIRSFEEHKDTPIIILTSLGTVDHVSAALTLGVCDFITKPFQGNILREKVAKHIVRKKLF